MEDVGELHRSLIKQGVDEETEVLMHSFHCLKTMLRDNSHVKRTSGAVTKRREAKPSTHCED